MIEINIRSNEGWELIAERKTNGTTWNITNPRGNKIQYQYDEAGFLKEVYADGEKTASFAYDQERREVAINYPKHTETVKYYENGYIREYRVKNKSQAKEEKLSFTYDSSNNITDIYGTGIGHINISYARDGSRPVGIITPLGRIKYTYNFKQRIKDIYLPENRSIHYSYNGENIEKLSFKNGSKQAKVLFDSGNIVKVKDFLGGNGEYKYSKENLLTDVTDPRSAKTEYSYDERNRLREIKLPDGRWIEYQYRERPTKGKESYVSNRDT